MHAEPDEMDLTQKIVGCVTHLVSGEIQAVLAIRYCQLTSLQRFALLVPMTAQT